MVGELYDQGGRIVYGEIIYDAALGNKAVTVIQSDCGKTLAAGGEPSPKGDLSPADKAALSDYTDCRIKAATAMALASNESAATIADASSGVSLKQRQAVVAGAGANGFEVVDALDREFRPCFWPWSSRRAPARTRPILRRESKRLRSTATSEHSKGKSEGRIR
jgi:hypothetical protein